MTNEELSALFELEDIPHVRVRGGDYTYEGWIVSAFPKRGGAIRCVVEDNNGRLFIHNAGNIECSIREIAP